MAIDFFQLNITAFEKQVYPDLKKAQLVGYNGMFPGPTFRVTRGRESVVRVVNEYSRPTVVHLHGSYTRPVWDGWAEDIIQPGQYKDYYYPNANTARTMWYHDHAAGITALNAYSGLAGFYIVEDPEVEAGLRLPQGTYDIPLALAAKQYTKDGDLTAVADEHDNLYGDIIEVNGQPWPLLNVEPRKYRFRILNTALSRTFVLSIVSESKVTSRDDKEASDAAGGIPFTVVASDAGFMSSAITTSKLVTAMAERWEIIFDFSPFAGQNLMMRNERKVFADDDFPATDKVLRFTVGHKVSSSDNNESLPTSLVSLDIPKTGSKIDRIFKFEKKHGTYLINGVGFADAENRIIANPPRGKTEIWSLENHSGDWSHPIHIHMVDFQILSRDKGRGKIEPYEKVALKDVAVLGPKESSVLPIVLGGIPTERVTVAIKFAPMEGLYMFHCHNLVHEDHDMMAAFNVSNLASVGYEDFDLKFSNPLDKEWRAQDISGLNAAGIKGQILPRFASTKAYRNITEIDEKLNQYWANRTDDASISSPQVYPPTRRAVGIYFLVTLALLYSLSLLP
ncbi:hypothetical protein QQS21_008724 [Conoideocrella luteorostrata]|uniref:Cupredoxin n=1 Tax=Conoideocrella luteorostrata TaxID=1105319 RepID=A0AAJ0FVP4_9HYPO|nr:hypothetical protein QQS21_008724 [Conoideocrella luteorostrata]